MVSKLPVRSFGLAEFGVYPLNNSLLKINGLETSIRSACLDDYKFKDADFCDFYDTWQQMPNQLPLSICNKFTDVARVHKALSALEAKLTSIKIDDGIVIIGLTVR